MILMKSNVRLYGPRIPQAIERLSNLADSLKDDLPISGGEVTFGKFDFVFNWLEDPKPQPLLLLLKRKPTHGSGQVLLLAIHWY